MASSGLLEIGKSRVDNGWQVSASALDSSVNFVKDDRKGKQECRYVRRSDEYFIVYLSSQNGCDRGCRMCHLTQTGQTSAQDASFEDLEEQAEQVLAWYRHELEQGAAVADKVHFNFMARGEPLNSAVIRNQGDEIMSMLREKSRSMGLRNQIKISTILPKTLDDFELTDIFRYEPVDIYYSLYSMDSDIRKRWLPRAGDVRANLDKLVRWQHATQLIPVLHWASIEGVNDDYKSVKDICEAVKDSGLRVDVNLVRYNPYSPRFGQEPTDAVQQQVADILSDMLPGSRVKIVSRVGFDVAASCGMFDS